MLFDTRRFFHSGRDSFLIAVKLIDAGANYDSCVRSLIIKPDRSERIAADVAIVAGKTSKGVVRFSSRSSRHFSSETGVNLGTDVMEHIGKIIGGEGGGHANAAGANGTKNRSEGMAKAIELLQSAIEKSVGERVG
jgi:nanoRNase/pAp phosphatase (c-di-AMP/oligoRNAs hydrolase)